MLTSKEQTLPTIGIAGGFIKLKRTIKKLNKFILIELTKLRAVFLISIMRMTGLEPAPRNPD